MKTLKSQNHTPASRNAARDEKFDFTIDWATIHCIPKEKLQVYAQNIDKHCNHGGTFLVRSFTGKNPKEKYFEEDVDGVKSKIFLLSKDNLKDLFPNFRIVAQNTSQPRTKNDYYFTELFMQKI